MKVDITIEDLLDERLLTEFADALLGLDESFSEMAKRLGFDKKRDFRYANLQGVDFSYSDLRGFDFTGADLSHSFGASIVLDASTRFDFASLSESIFEARVINERLLNKSIVSQKLYGLLKEGDPYVFSDWALGGADRLPRNLTVGLTNEEGEALRRRLLFDHIDITKRKTLFYQLKAIASSEELSEIISQFLAFHLGDSSVIRGFIEVAVRLFRGEASVIKAVLFLCGHDDPMVRLAAFQAISGTEIFSARINYFKEIILSESNTEIRKQLIMNSARKLGRSHFRSVSGQLDFSSASLDSVVDYEEILSGGSVRRIQSRGKTENSRQSTREISERQSEVLAYTPILSKFFKYDNPDSYSEAIERYDRLSGKLEASMTKRIEMQYRYGHS